MAVWSSAAMSRLDDVLREAELLEPEERLQLIGKLWESLPPDHWAAPTPDQRSELHLRAEANGDPAQKSVWDAVHWLVTRTSGPNRPKIYSATRRFDLATVFVAMAVYSIFL